MENSMTSAAMFDVIHHLAQTDPTDRELDRYLALLTARIGLLSAHIPGVDRPPMPLRTVHLDEAPRYAKLMPLFQRHGLELCLLRLDTANLVQLAARTALKGERPV